MALPFSLRGYAAQLDQIQRSLWEMAKESGEYKDIVLRMAVNVRSTSNVLRAASHVIVSMESHKEHEANKAARGERRDGRLKTRAARVRH